MIIFKIISTLISLFAFFFGAIKLWKKGKPLYFQIIICAVGCCALYNLAIIVMTFCDVNETYFNDSYFGLFGCNLFLFCANYGAIDKLFDRPKTKYVVISILLGVLTFALSVVVGILFYGVTRVAFYLFVLMELPACFVVYFNVKHLFSPVDELGMIKGLRLTDIFSLIFCVLNIVDIALWINLSVVSEIVDLISSLVILALSVSAVKGAEKWSF